MKKRVLRQWGAACLALCLALAGLFGESIANGQVHAAQDRQLSVSKFADAEDLAASFDMNDGYEKATKKVYFGENGAGAAQTWYIVGGDSQGQGLVLFAATPLAKKVVFSSTTNDKTKPSGSDIDWGTTEYGNPCWDVYANHYGASEIRALLKKLETDTAYFSAAQQALMLPSKVFTYDQKNRNKFWTNDKLYLGYNESMGGHQTSFQLGSTSEEAKYGALSVDLKVLADNTNNTNKGHFWLRSPITNNRVTSFAATVNYDETYMGVKSYAVTGSFPNNDSYDDWDRNLVPAFQLDLSKVVFGSNVTTVKSEGSVRTDSVFTLRYQKESLGSVKIYDNNLAEIKNAVSGAYLVVQSENGAWAKQLTGGDETLRPSEVTINGAALDSFENCEIWIEEQGDDGLLYAVRGTRAASAISLSGNGVFDTLCVDYSEAGERTFTIQNTGDYRLTGISLHMEDENSAFELQSENTKETLELNESTSVTLALKEGLAIGEYQGTLQVTSDNGVSDSIDVSVRIQAHDYTAEITEPSCTQGGYTTYTCKNCGHSYTGDVTQPKGHQWSEWMTVEASSCTKAGYEERRCEECGLTQQRDLDLAAHEWEDFYTIDQEATCTKEGSQSIHCQHCDARKDAQTILPLGHLFVDYVSNGDADCIHDGTMSAVCERCDQTDTKTQEGSALGHALHNVAEKEATCMEEGHLAYWQCERCERCFLDADALQEVTADQLLIAALGHDEGMLVNVKEATVSEEGYTGDLICTRCHTLLKKGEIIPRKSTGNDEETDGPAPSQPSSDQKDDAGKEEADQEVTTGVQENGVYLWTGAVITAFAGVILCVRKRNAKRS